MPDKFVVLFDNGSGLAQTGSSYATRQLAVAQARADVLLDERRRYVARVVSEVAAVKTVVAEVTDMDGVV